MRHLAFVALALVGCGSGADVRQLACDKLTACGKTSSYRPHYEQMCQAVWNTSEDRVSAYWNCIEKTACLSLWDCDSALTGK